MIFDIHILENKRKNNFSIFRIVVEFESVEALRVVGVVDLVDGDVTSQQPPGGVVKAESEAYRYVDENLGEVMRTGHVQLIKPAVFWYLVASCHDVTCNRVSPNIV